MKRNKDVEESQKPLNFYFLTTKEIQDYSTSGEERK